MEQTEQILVENVSNVQLIDIDRLFPKTRRQILWGVKSSHDFNILPIDVVEDKPAIFYSHKDAMFLEVFIDHIQRFQNGGTVSWHEIEIKMAS